MSLLEVLHREVRDCLNAKRFEYINAPDLLSLSLLIKNLGWKKLMEDIDPNELFKYTPLTDAVKEIRVVHLEVDCTSTPYGLLPQCTLTVAHAKGTDTEHRWAHAKYTAVSCAWRSWSGTENDSLILINGKYKRVTSNLAGFLNNATEILQQSHVESLVLWCDAISINQDDDVEKSEQVLNMGAIFNDATEVVIWLGEADADSHLAFRFLHDLSWNYDLVTDRLRSYAGSEVEYPVHHWLNNIEQNYNETVVPLRALTDRPWWGRIWMYAH